MKNTAVNIVIGLTLAVFIGLQFAFYGELKGNQSELKVLSDQIERLQLEVDGGRKKNSDNKKNIELNQWEISRLVKQAGESQKHYEGLKKRNSDCLKKIAEGKQKLVEVNKKLDKLKAESPKKVIRTVSRKKIKSSPKFSSGIPEEKLSDVKLPFNATKEQTEKYIDSILSFSEDQRTFSSRDPQIAMLEKIAHKHLPLLAERMSGAWGPKNYHVSLAVANLAEETDKDFIIKSLAKYPSLINAVIRFGWEKDVKDIIFNEITDNKYLPGEWITCASKLATPAEYKMLTEALEKSHNRYHTYKAIKDLQGIKLDAAVAKIWSNRGMFYSDWERKNVALIAADYGYVDALKAVVEMCRDKSRYMQKLAYNKAHSLTGQSGSYSKLKKWLESNGDKLIFDKKKQRYFVKK